MPGLSQSTIIDKGESRAGSEALRLFRDHTLSEVKDIDLELSNKITKVHGEFTKELQTHYWDILTVTNEVNSLYSALKDADSLLTDLCFKDDIYKVKKLPEILQDSTGAKSRPGFTLSGESESKSQGSKSSAVLILIVSNWTLAVGDFVRRFTTSSNSGQLFERALEEYGILIDNINEMLSYREIVSSKNHDFLSYIVADDDCQDILNVFQWVRLYNLVLRDKDEKLGWDSKLVNDFDSMMFKRILSEHMDTLLNSKDDLIREFVLSNTFQSRLRDKILSDIDHQFTQLDQLLNSDVDETSDDPSTQGNLSTIDIVEESRLYSMGLVTSFRVSLYNIVEPLIKLLQKLKAHGGELQKTTDISKSLINILEQVVPADPEPPINDTTSQDMDNLVSSMILRYNNAKFTTLINTHIQELSE